MATTNTNELSAYTIAKNCTDLSDVNAGLDELTDYFTACEKVGKKPTATAYIRFSKLAIKRDKFTIKKFKLTFSDKVTYNEIKSELSFDITEAKKWLKEKYPEVKKIEYKKNNLLE